MRSSSKKWMLLGMSLALACGQCQPARAASANSAKTPDNSSNTVPMQATSTVGSCVTVEAVLIPRDPAAKLFGGWVADNYAVVKTTISNHCPDQQFILHDIYFDYRDWSLSGVYPELSKPTPCPAAAQAASPTAAPGTVPPTAAPGTATPAPAPAPGDSPQKPATGCPAPAQEYTQDSKPGQVATVGALDVQDQLTEASVFSRRNLIVNGLVLVGTVAGGYAFIGSTAWTQGIGAYNSAFIPGFQKFWPDRRIDQEKNVLSLGYRTDQSTAIAKDDHGSYYAFFPLAAFLVPELKALFLSDPAAFLNPAEVLFDISGRHTGSGGGMAKSFKSKSKKGSEESLRDFLLDIVAAIPGGSQPQSTDEAARRGQSVKLLLELAAPCTEQDCHPYDKDTQQRILAEKFLFQHASLNAVKIVARGVMTVNVESIPPTIDTVTFDNEKDGSSLWTVQSAAPKPPAPNPSGVNPSAAGDPPAAGKTQRTAATPAQGSAPSAAASATPAPATPSTAAAASTSSGAAAKDLTGVIAGKFLTDGTPAITAIAVPGADGAKLTDYIVDKSLQAVSAKATDTSLPFKLQLAKTLPAASTLTFQVSHSTGDSSQGASAQTTSNKFVYTVTYAATPKIAKVTMDNDDKADVWQTPGKLNGTAAGTDLDGGTIAVSTLKVGGKDATLADYIGTLVEVPKSSSATELAFQLQLLKPVPDGSTLSFVVSKGTGANAQSDPKDYAVTNPAAAAKPPAATAAKPAATANKPTATAAKPAQPAKKRTP